MMRRLTSFIIIIALATGAQAGDARLPENFWLLGDFTQNVRCKGAGSDPAEVKVKIATDQIVSKVGLCSFIGVKPEGEMKLNATMQCEFPAGPLIGDVTFTRKTNGTIDVVDRDGTFNGTLYRCPK